MKCLEGDIEDAGGEVVLDTEVRRVDPHSGGGWVVQTQSGSEDPVALRTELLVNAAGLEYASRLDDLPER